MSTPLRILYAAGPGDVIGTLRHWRAGDDDSSEVAMTYSGQFFDVCRAAGLEAIVISTHSDAGRAIESTLDVRHVPVPFAKRGGVLFHVGQVWHALRLVVAAVRLRADAAVVAGITHWYVLLLLKPFGVAVIPALHCVLWPKFGGPRKAARLINPLDKLLFRRCHAILSISQDASDQVAQLTGGKHPPILPFVPTYRRATFDAMPAPNAARRPFRVLYAGRIESNKGVFDLLDTARRCEEQRPGLIEWDLCGSGSQLNELRRRVEEAGLSKQFRTHGHTKRERMREFFAGAHAVVVPTRTEFVEGFNKVVTEAVLAGRPCVTSAVCPALAEVEPAVMVVPPNDAGAYANAVLQLAEDRALYEEKQDACAMLSERFYDVNAGWGAALQRALNGLKQRQRAAATPAAERA